VQFVDVETLFSLSDVVTLHAPLTDENEGLVNKKLLQKMKPSAFLINTARGGLIVEEDLKNALEAGRLAGAALDVLQQEPPPEDHPLFMVENCLITPHQAWATREARERLLEISIENVAAFLRGKPENVVA
jgi:glycerate dehydrogenase